MPEIPYEQGAYYIFDRGYNDFGNLYRINLLDAHFVLRAKRNLKIHALKWKRRLPVGVKSDSIVEFTVYKSAKAYPEKLRRVVWIDAETRTEYVFLTNDLTAPAATIAGLYHNRWSIELFFKWIKQHLKNQAVLGHYPKCCSHPNLLCHNHLLPGRDCAARLKTRTKCLRNAPNFGHLADRQNPAYGLVRQIESQLSQ